MASVAGKACGLLEGKNVNRSQGFTTNKSLLEKLHFLRRVTDTRAGEQAGVEYVPSARLFPVRRRGEIGSECQNN